MACASRHYHAGAGAGNGMKNMLSPGLNGGDTVFDRTASGGHGPNYALRRTDFPKGGATGLWRRVFRLLNQLRRQSCPGQGGVM